MSNKVLSKKSPRKELIQNIKAEDMQLFMKLCQYSRERHVGDTFYYGLTFYFQQKKGGGLNMLKYSSDLKA